MVITTIDITFLYALTALLNLGIGLSVLRQNPRSASHRWLFIFTMVQLGWIGSLYFGYYYIAPYQEAKSLFFIRFAQAFGLLMYPTLVAFFYHFPKKTFHIPRIIQALFWIPILVMAGIAAGTDLVHVSQILREDGFYMGDVFGPLYGIFTYMVLGPLALSGIFAIKKLIDSKGTEKKRIGIAAIGCISFLIMAVTANVILPTYGIYIFIHKTVLYSLLFLIPAFYSVQHHRFFHFSYVSLKFIRKLILATVFVVSLFVFNLFFLRVFSDITETTRLFASALIGLFIYAKTQQFFPEILSQSFREFRETVSEFGSVVAYADSYPKLTLILEKIFRLKLNITDAKVYLVRDRKADTNIPIYLKDNFTKQLNKEKVDVLVLDELKSSDKQEDQLLIKSMKAIPASVCFPLYLGDNLIGLFTLGPKANKKDNYSSEEIQELVNQKRSLEICFLNIILKSDLKEENDLMKQIITRKTQRLKKQNREIKNMLRQQSDFLAVTAHEFRTPLNIALLQLEDTLESHEHQEEAREGMEVVGSSLEKLRCLTEKLFDVQQYDLDNVKLTLSEVEIGAFVEETHKNFKDIMAEKKIRLSFKNELSGTISLRVDQPQMRQVLHNILSNAYKFTPESGEVAIRVEDNPKHVSIHISDSGRGIKDEDKKRIFKKFQTTHHSMGIGMGLYLCKRIVELHKGSISVSDNPKGGSIFTVTLKRNAS